MARKKPISDNPRYECSASGILRIKNSLEQSKLRIKALISKKKAGDKSLKKIKKESLRTELMAIKDILKALEKANEVHIFVSKENSGE